MNLQYQLFRNSFTTLAQIALTTVVGLALPPILVAYLGLTTYGIWSLIILINAYVALLDLGFQSGLIKFTAEAAVQGDNRRILHLVNASLFVYTGLLLVGSLLSLIGGRVFSRFLLNGVPDATSYVLILEIYAVVALVGLVTVPFSCLLKGMQRYDQSNLVEMVAMLLNATCSVSLVVAGWGLWALLTGAGSAAFWRLLAYTWLARRAFPPLELALHWALPGMRDALNQLARLSSADLSQRMYSVVTQSIVRLAINAYAGAAFVGAYDIAKRVVGQVTGTSTIVFVPLVPAVSALAAQGRRESLVELLRRCFLYLGMIGIPLTCFLLIFYNPLLQAWLGFQDISAISLAGRLLLIATFADLFTGPATTASIGLGNPNLQVLKLFLTTVSTFALVLGLGQEYGFPGILVGEMGAMLVGTFTGLFFFQSWFHIPVIRMILVSVARVLLATLPIWLALAAIWLALPQWQMWDSLMTWAVVITTGLVGTGALYWLTGLISTYEVDLVRNALLPRRSQAR